MPRLSQVGSSVTTRNDRSDLLRVGDADYWGLSLWRTTCLGSKTCSCEQVRPNRLQNALAALGDAMREVNAAIEEMRTEHDPQASHIFVSRRHY